MALGKDIMKSSSLLHVGGGDLPILQPATAGFGSRSLFDFVNFW